MCEQYTDCAEEAIERAYAIARGFGSEYLSTEHILLSFVRGGRHSTAVSILNDLSITAQNVEDAFKVLVGIQLGIPSTLKMKLPITPRGRNALKYAVASAKDLGHEKVGTGHLVLGLWKEDVGIAHLMLSALLARKMGDVTDDVLSELICKKMLAFHDVEGATN